MLNITVVQPSYFAGENPDEKIAQFLIEQLKGVAPDGQILKDMEKDVGSVSAEIDPFYKYMRTAGFGGDTVRNDDFISGGLCPEAF